MKFIGENLKKERLRLNLKISYISNELKISEDLLEDIEKNDFPEYIDTVFLIGHINSYSNFLNLNSKEIIEDFKIQISYKKPNIKNEISKPIILKNLLPFYKVFSFASMIIIATSFYFLFVKPSGLNIKYVMTPDVPENLISDLEAAQLSIALLDNKNETLDEIFIKESVHSLSSKDIKLNYSSVNASLQTKEIENVKKEITLKFLDATWIQLRDKKDNIILSKLMYRGDEYSYGFSENFYLTAGNAGNIIVSLNGLVVGKAGKLGEVIDSFLIDNNFQN